MRRPKLSLLTCVLLLVAMLLPNSAEALLMPSPIEATRVVTLLQHNYNAIPLYRVYRSNTSYYTTDLREYADLLSGGDGMGVYSSQVVAYISRHQIPGLVPVYRSAVSSFLYGRLYDQLLSDATVGFGTTVIGYAYSAATPASSTSGPVYEWVYCHAAGTNSWGVTTYKTDYHYDQNAAWAGSGYELRAPVFTAWREPTAIQTVTIGDLPSTLQGRSQVEIQWRTKIGGGLVKLMYSIDGGANWVPVSDTMLANPAVRPGVYNSFTWTVPNVSTTQLRIKAQWYPGRGGDLLAWASTPQKTITRNTMFATYSLVNTISVLSGKPTAPTDLIAVVSQPGTLAPEIRLYWADNSYNETGYTVQRWVKGNTASLVTYSLPADSKEYKNTSVTPGTEYVYQVVAKGDTNSEPSNQVTATYVAQGQTVPYLLTIQPPAAPTGLRATLVAGTANEVRLTWIPSTSMTPGQEIQRKLPGADWSFLAEGRGQATSYTDRGLPAGTSGDISYRVLAVGGSAPSNPSGVATLALAAAPPSDPGPGPGEPVYDGTQSQWAQPEVTLAFQNGLTYPGVMFEYQRNITREEFCTVAVRLYEKLSGQTAMPGEDPFADTDNVDILKAYALGIVRGVTATQFAPGNNITRQDMCVMIYRALQAAGKNTLLMPDSEFPFGDAGQIGTWAMNEVRFCYQKQIMKGTSPTTISPLVNTPREQAIVLIYRTHKAFK